MTRFETITFLIMGTLLLGITPAVRTVYVPRPQVKPPMIIRNGQPVFMGNILDIGEVK